MERSIRPGGWFELQELYLSPASVHDGRPLNSKHPVAAFYELWRGHLALKGIDAYLPEKGRFTRKLLRAGFVNVNERVIHIPIGLAASHPHKSNAGVIFRDVLKQERPEEVYPDVLRAAGWTLDRIHEFLMTVKVHFHDEKSLMYMPLLVVYGQKPENNNPPWS